MFIDDIIINVVNLKSACNVNCAGLSIILYAYDILLLAPSIKSLQKLVTICASELASLDMTINKSVCMAHVLINTVLIKQFKMAKN